MGKVSARAKEVLIAPAKEWYRGGTVMKVITLLVLATIILIACTHVNDPAGILKKIRPYKNILVGTFFLGWLGLGYYLSDPSVKLSKVLRKIAKVRKEANNLARQSMRAMQGRSLREMERFEPIYEEQAQLRLRAQELYSMAVHGDDERSIIQALDRVKGPYERLLGRSESTRVRWQQFSIAANLKKVESILLSSAFILLVREMQKRGERINQTSLDAYQRLINEQPNLSASSGGR